MWFVFARLPSHRRGYAADGSLTLAAAPEICYYQTTRRNDFDKGA